MEIIPRYLAKSGCDEGVGEILAYIRMECHNPFILSCVLLDDEDRLVGFLVAYIVITRLGKRIFVDHVYAPNMNMADKLCDMVREKLGVEDMCWITHRDPAAWIKFSRRKKRPVELYGYMIRTVPDLTQFGQAKED